jgi:hypothetical protein
VIDYRAKKYFIFAKWLKVSSVSRRKKLEKRGEVGGRESDETAQ